MDYVKDVRNKIKNIISELCLNNCCKCNKEFKAKVTVDVDEICPDCWKEFDRLSNEEMKKYSAQNPEIPEWIARMNVLIRELGLSVSDS